MFLAGAHAARAQEMEPRAYSVSPVGTNFFAIIAGGSHGEILFDPAIPVIDTKANLGLGSLGYGRSFALGGRQGLVTIAVPYVWGHVQGTVLEESRRVSRSGFGDVRLKGSVNLIGPKAMSLEEFRKAPRSTVLGVSLTVVAPLGEYDGTKLINIGTNRFAFKPEIGLSVPVGRWYLDAYAGVWLFESNDDFFPGGTTREQDPLYAIQGHASYTFRNRAWLAVTTTWYSGGQSRVDDGPETQRQSNTRIGGAFSFPLTPRQSIKIAAGTGAWTRTGSDFDTAIVAWQFTWFDKPSASP